MARKERFDEEDILAYDEGRPMRFALRAVVARITSTPPWTLAVDLARTRTPHVFCLTAHPTESFQVRLRTRVIEELEAARLLWTPYDAREGFVWSEHQDLAARVLSQKNHFNGGIIFAGAWGREYSDDLFRFAIDFGGPLILLDRARPISLRLPPNVTYLSVSDFEGARLAARYLLASNKKAPVKNGLMISSTAKCERVTVPLEILHEKLPDCRFDVSFDGGFCHERAAEVTFTMGSRALREGRPYDAIYTTSAAMGLGVETALIELCRRHECQRPVHLVYDGFDGIAGDLEVGGPVDAVVQDIDALASTAVATMVDQIFSLAPPVSEKLIGPYLEIKGRVSPFTTWHHNLVAEEFDAQLRATALLLRSEVSNETKRLAVERVNEQLASIVNTSGRQLGP